MTPDLDVKVEITYNGQEFFEVLTDQPLTYVQRPTISNIFPPFGFGESEMQISLSGQRIENAHKIYYELLGQGQEALIEDIITANSENILGYKPPFQNISSVGEMNLFG